MIRRLAILFGLLSLCSAQEFRAVDLFVDSGDAALAAWQVELTFDRADVGITGIEASAPGAKPPVYDSRGLQAGKIKLADFSLKPQGFGNGPVHVARLHLVQHQPGAINAALHTAASPDGTKLKGLKVFTRPATAIAIASPVAARKTNGKAPAKPKAEAAVDAPEAQPLPAAKSTPPPAP